MISVLEMFGEPITFGGQESVVKNMLSSFDLKKDFNIDLFTPYYSDNKEIIDLVEKNNGKVIALNIAFKTGDNRFLLRKPVNEFFNNAKKYDVVHIHTGSLTTMYVYAMIAKKHRVKKVIVHSHIANTNDSLVKKVYKNVLCFLMKKFIDIYMGCSRNAIDTKFTKDIQKKAIVVNNGIEVEKYKYNEKYRLEIREKYNINDKFVIGSLGRISKQKNNKFIVDIFVELLNNFDDINKNKIVLMMVGDGDFLYEVKKYADEKKLTNNIIFTGNQVETYKYYQAFDVFIMPSIFEGLPVTSLEAQMSGITCLLSDKVDENCNISSKTKFLSIESTKEWVLNICDEINNYIDTNGYINMNVKNDDNNSEINIERNIKNNVDRYDVKIDFDKYDRKKTYEIVKKIYNEK